MILYHRTTDDAAEQILREGFRDATGFYGTDQQFSGVWLSNVPLDGNEGAKGDTLLQVYLSEQVIADYEWIEDGKPYREWLVPAQLANQQAKVSVAVEADEFDPDLYRVPPCSGARGLVANNASDDLNESRTFVQTSRSPVVQTDD